MKLIQLGHLLAKREVLGFGVRLISVLASAALNILLARTLGPESFGLLWFVLSVLLLLAGLLRIGAANFLVREVAATFERQNLGLLRGLIRRALQTVLIGSLILTVCVFGMINLTKSLIPPGSYNLFLIGLPIIPLLGLMGVLEGITRGFGNMVRGQIAEFIIRPCVILAYVVFAFKFELLPYNLVYIILGFCFSATIAVVAAYILRDTTKLKILTSHSPKYTNPIWARSVMTLSLTAWLGLFNTHLNPILLGSLSTPNQVSLFQVSSQLAFLASFMVVVMNSLQGADFSKYYVQNDIEKLQQLATRSCRLSLIFSIVFSLCFVFWGSQIVTVLFGISYQGAYPVLLVITLGTFINAISGSAGTLMNSCHQEKQVLSALLWAFGVSLSAAFLLIPLYGAIGAAFSVTLSLATWNSILIYKTRKILGIWSLPFALKIQLK